jgi:hypothetical protein
MGINHIFPPWRPTKFMGPDMVEKPYQSLGIAPKYSQPLFGVSSPLSQQEAHKIKSLENKQNENEGTKTNISPHPGLLPLEKEFFVAC